ncbi:heavy metal translocating P-type ATPase [Aliiglaciecola sp. LCG003]|uniref:heavy metal translocating P-type ATPase n=1 Tax=Aliiglaciecola sp. LCG003 TaxID=3053655 RepID=UPI0025734235|nr:heavy metal translocating P-type ATPase [Aliiglaciecola sp. LCG003]WJG07604.1 heavy metal translocating P-type ATPase [Aliiglaciecola sp. LCG003]
MESPQPEQCYHCGLPIVPGQIFQATILNQSRSLCCPGCKAVAESIISNGLEDYYRFRTEFADKGDELLDQTLDTLKAYDHPDIQQEFVTADADDKQIQLTIEGISCAACGWLIEKQLLKLSGVNRVAVNVSARRAIVNWNDKMLSLSDIIFKLEKVGYHALPFHPDEHEASYQKEHRQFLKRIGLAGLMSMQVMMLAIGLYFGIFGSIDQQTKQYFHWVSLVLTTPVVLYSGFEFYKSAFNALRMKSLNMDFSVSLAIIGTFLASVWATYTQTGEIYFESVCMFIFLLLISRYIEHRTRYKASQISANMFKYIPLTAMVIDDGIPQSCLAKHLEIGQKVLVKPGETIPIDGTISAGNGKVDESMLTGEAEQVSKQTGDAVYGGTLNLNGTLTIDVGCELKYALVNRILRLQESALAAKPKAAIFADVASRYFILAVLVITVISYLAWLAYQPERAFWIAIAILVATCPCALSLATPTALTSALAKLNESGILLKRADVLDQIPEIDCIVFDKTGTLTQGYFSIVNIELFSNVDKQMVLNLAAGLEAYSEHPLASAFTRPTGLKVEDVESVSGYGLKGVYQQHEVKIGKREFLHQSAVLEAVDPSFSIFLQMDNKLLAAFEMRDQVRPEASELIASLSNHDVYMLSGDNHRNAQQVAQQIGIKKIMANQTPSQKLAFIETLQSRHKMVMMVGDGINDAPVLARADVSVAVGSAADMSKRSADIILLNNRLSAVTTIFDMGSKARRKVKQNMSWAIGYNLFITPLAVLGYLSPWMAVIGMSLSSIIVVVNSVRLMRS